MAAVVLKMQQLEASRSSAPRGSFSQQGGLSSTSPRWLLEPSAFPRASGNFPRKSQGYVGGRKVCLGLLSQPPSALHCLGAWGCLWLGLSLAQPRGHLLWSWPLRAALYLVSWNKSLAGTAPWALVQPPQVPCYPIHASSPSRLLSSPGDSAGSKWAPPSCSLLFYLTPASCTPAQQGWWGTSPQTATWWGSAKVPRPSRGLRAPGEGFPPEGAPFPRTGGRQQREIGALRELACRAADRTPSCSLALASPAEHVAIPASVSREQGRHFSSGDEAAS